VLGQLNISMSVYDFGTQCCGWTACLMVIPCSVQLFSNFDSSYLPRMCALSSAIQDIVEELFGLC
jgi:hypothetical protein